MKKKIKKRQNIKGAARCACLPPHVCGSLYVFSFLYLFSLMCALEGTFATMGPALHGTLAPEHQVQGSGGLEAAQGMLAFNYAYQSIN